MSDVFDALASPVRRKILTMLRDQDLSAGEIATHLDITKPTLSGHFNVLKSAGLVHTERRGTTIIYSLNTSLLEDMLAGMAEMFKINKDP